MTNTDMDFMRGMLVLTAFYIAVNCAHERGRIDERGRRFNENAVTWPWSAATWIILTAAFCIARWKQS